MAIDLRHMLKVYNYINDEKRPKVNLKFLGLFAAFAIATGALVAFAFQFQGGPSGPPPAADTAQTEYVGLTAAEIELGVPQAVAQERLMEWQAAHPGVQIDRAEAVYQDGRIVGFWVTYRGA